MTDTREIEMKIHSVKDRLGSIEHRLERICGKVEALMDKIEESRVEFKAIEEKLK